MKLIEVTYDSAGNNPIGDMTKFDPIMAGEKTERKIYVKNLINFPVTLDIKVDGEDVELSNDLKRLNPNEVKDFILIFSPKLTKLKPINVDLKISAISIIE